MDNCSYFLNNKAYFGSYPTQESVEILEEHGVRIFVDLTTLSESKIIPYKTKYMYISFPINDHHTPKSEKTFIDLIYRLVYIITNTPLSDKMYIHCKGGHGRSGVVVACIYCLMFNKTPMNAISYTTKCHNNRKNMRDKWRNIGSPQTETQKIFVCKICTYLKLDKTSHLSYEFKRIINIKDQHFTSINEAVEYLTATTCKNIKEIIYSILQSCLEQDGYFKESLLDTGIRQIKITNDNHNSAIYSRLLLILRYQLMTGSI